MSSDKTKGYKKLPMDESNDVGQLRERIIKTQLNVSPKDVKDGSNELTVAKCHSTQSLETALKQLLPTVSVSPTIPVKTTGQNAKELFGKAPYHSKKIILRTSEQIKQGSAIELPQFDPNFFSLDKVHCRYPDCPETRARNLNHSSKTNKEDLYLCPNHRKEMVDVVTKQCEEEGITVNFKDSKIEDFNGYTSLIGQMEKAFQHFKEKSCLQVPYCSGVNGFLAEIFLNVRNYFIITNIVLNPDPENVTCILSPVTTILTEVIKQCKDAEFVKNLTQLLSGVMEILLRSFNVIYYWVTLALERNPGAQIGAGFGCAAGALAAGAAFGPTALLIVLGAGIGFVSGGLVGGGIFNLKMGNYDQRNAYHFTGNRDGSFNVQVLH